MPFSAVDLPAAVLADHGHHLDGRDREIDAGRVHPRQHLLQRSHVRHFAQGREGARSRSTVVC
jgi:hypothetical protein